MVWVGESLVSVKGSRENEVACGLEVFCEKSKTAKKLMKQCSQNQLVLSVAAGGGEDDTCHCVSKNEVKLFWADCNNEPRQMCETALFEMNNSLNSEEKDALGKKLKGNKITLLDYGYGMATHEAPSTTLVHDALLDLRGYRPSVWGLKQRMTAASGVRMGIRIESIFANSKHKADATTGSLSMKSKHLYVYDAFGTGLAGTAIIGSSSKLKMITTNIHPGGDWPEGIHHRQMIGESYRWNDLISAWNKRYGDNKPTLRKFWAAYIQALDQLKNKEQWTIAWNQSGSKGTWLALAKEIARVDNLSPNWITQIVDDMKAKYATY